MLRLSATAFAAVLVAGTVQAADKRAEAAAEKVSEAAFLLVGISYLCSDAVGNAHYHASRMMAEAAIKGLGTTDDEAVIHVDDFAARAKRENPVKAPAENMSKCMDAILQAQSDLKVSQARFRTIISELEEPKGK